MRHTLPGALNPYPRARILITHSRKNSHRTSINISGRTAMAACRVGRAGMAGMAGPHVLRVCAGVDPSSSRVQRHDSLLYKTAHMGAATMCCRNGGPQFTTTKSGVRSFESVFTLAALIGAKSERNSRVLTCSVRLVNSCHAVLAICHLYIPYDNKPSRCQSTDICEDRRREPHFQFSALRDCQFCCQFRWAKVQKRCLREEPAHSMLELEMRRRICKINRWPSKAQRNSVAFTGIEYLTVRRTLPHTGMKACGQPARIVISARTAWLPGARTTIAQYYQTAADRRSESIHLLDTSERK